MKQDPRTMLPSQEMDYLQARILEKLEKKPFRAMSAEPGYHSYEAVDDFKSHSREVRIREAYSKALVEFNRKWPLGWEPDSGAYRDIHGKRVYCSS